VSAAEGRRQCRPVLPGMRAVGQPLARNRAPASTLGSGALGALCVYLRRMASVADPCFAALLDDTVTVRRPSVQVSTGGNPRTAQYDYLCGDVPCSLQPVGAQVREGLLGRLERVTHVAYLEPLELRAGDLLLQTLRATSLSEVASSGARTVAVSDAAAVARGDRLEIGEGAESELGVAALVDGATVQLMTPLVRSHEAGEGVSVVGGYEVVGARDEAGRGHHIRADLRQLTA